MTWKWLRNLLAPYRVIDQDDAVQRGLVFYRNVYGDEINFCNCRSFWTDNDYLYRVNQLYKNDTR